MATRVIKNILTLVTDAVRFNELLYLNTHTHSHSAHYGLYNIRNQINSLIVLSGIILKVNLISVIRHLSPSTAN
jgi:hypothetical protein